MDPSKIPSLNPLLTEEEKQAPFHIFKWNNSPGLKEWGYRDPEDGTTDPVTKEMLVEGAFEGTIFPSYMEPNRNLTLFRKAFCRPVPITFIKESISEEGFDVYEYQIAPYIFETVDQHPGNRVYCHKGRCPKRGLGNIAPCYYDIPIVLSLPHFLNSDPSILASLDGLAPNETQHQGIALIHSKYGLPLGGNLRIQINLDVGETKFNTITKPFNGLVMPLFWIEMSIAEIPQLVYILVNLGCHIGPIIQLLAAYLLAFIGVSLISGSACLVLFFTKPPGRSRLSLQTEYSQLPIINIPAQYFTEMKIQK